MIGLKTTLSSTNYLLASDFAIFQSSFIPLEMCAFLTPYLDWFKSLLDGFFASRPYLSRKHLHTCTLLPFPPLNSLELIRTIWLTPQYFGTASCTSFLSPQLNSKLFEG